MGTNPRPAQQQPPLPPVRKGKALAPAGELQQRSLRTGADKQGLAWTRWWGAAIPQTPGSITRRAGVTATGFSPHHHGKTGFTFLEQQHHRPSCQKGQQQFGISPTPSRAALSSPPAAELFLAEHGPAAGEEPFCGALASRGSTRSLSLPSASPASRSIWVSAVALGLPGTAGGAQDEQTHPRCRDGTAVLPQAPEGLQLQRERGLRVLQSLQSPLARCWAGSIPTRGASWLLSQMTHQCIL